jgi:hypothetical protein
VESTNHEAPHFLVFSVLLGCFLPHRYKTVILPVILMTKAYKSLAGKLEVKRPVIIPGRRREDNIRMDVRETG